VGTGVRRALALSQQALNKGSVQAYVNVLVMAKFAHEPYVVIFQLLPICCSSNKVLVVMLEGGGDVQRSPEDAQCCN